MILNVSGRTDIVAFYMDWFVNGWKRGYFDVQNPFNDQMISRIYVKDVDMIVFCTKNSIPLLNTIDLFQIPIQLQVTITGYHQDLEPKVPDKKYVIEALKKISYKIGHEHCIVRYDPILLNSTYPVEYHIRAFDKLCSLLSGYVDTIVISFLDDYKNVRYHQLEYHEPSKYELKILSHSMNESCAKYGMHVQTCFEGKVDGFDSACCVSVKYAFERTGKLFGLWKARDCGCVSMVDIGAYNCCLHGCKYCYANFDESKILDNVSKHDSNSSILIGTITDQEIKIRKK